MSHYFDPSNPIIRICMQSSMLMEGGERQAGLKLLEEVHQESLNEMELYLLHYFLAKLHLEWTQKCIHLEKALACAQKAENPSATSAFGTLYKELSVCYEHLERSEDAILYNELSEAHSSVVDEGPFYHGTKADLHTGDLLVAGKASNYKSELMMNHIYFTAQADGAGLAAALAKGEGEARVYQVKPTGEFENDPNVTDKKFPGNPTRSYRSTEPLEIVAEVKEWKRITAEELKMWQERLAKTSGEIIN